MITTRTELKLFILIFLIYSLCFSSFGQPVKASSPFVGFWHAIYNDYAPPYTIGAVLIKQIKKGEFTAVILNIPLHVTVTKKSVEFFNNDKSIGFKGSFSNDSTEIVGHWIQNRFASPVKFIRAKDLNIWQGIPDVNSGKQDIFFNITEDSSGILKSEISDRGFNLGAFIKINRTEVDSHYVRMFQDNDTIPILIGIIKNQAIVCYTSLAKSYSLTLVKSDPNNQAALLPRLSPNYTYSVPAKDDDGWQTSNLQTVGLNKDTISALVKEIISGTGFPKVFSLLIARHNKLALEEYFYGFSKQDLQDTRSAGKIFTSALTGIAIDKGFIKSDSSPVYPFFKEYKSFNNFTPAKNNIKIKNLLTMTSGLDCNDFIDSSPGNEDKMQSQDKEQDWYKYILDLPLANKPGEKAFYCSGAVNLLGGIITNTSGTWTPGFMQRYLFDPLGIKKYYFNLTPLLNGYMAGGIQLRPRDMLKFGQLYLNNGLWNKSRVVPSAWINESLIPKVSIYGKGLDFGYLWWYDHVDYNGIRFDCFSAQGNGGQFIYIIPRLDIVCVITGGNYGQFRKWMNFKKIISDYIIPAAND